jgi:hypothetical protein
LTGKAKCNRACTQNSKGLAIRHVKEFPTSAAADARAAEFLEII